MPGRIRRLPSAALVISVIALFIALGGGAYAVSVAKKNSVVSKSIENGQVKTKDLAKNAVNSAKVANNSLTGNDVKESSLGAVPLATHATGADSATNASHATSADTATNASTVGGETVKKFFMKGPANTPETEILHLDGLRRHRETDRGRQQRHNHQPAQGSRNGQRWCCVLRRLVDRKFGHSHRPHRRGLGIGHRHLLDRRRAGGELLLLVG